MHVEKSEHRKLAWQMSTSTKQNSTFGYLRPSLKAAYVNQVNLLSTPFLLAWACTPEPCLDLWLSSPGGVGSFRE